MTSRAQPVYYGGLALTLAAMVLAMGGWRHATVLLLPAGVALVAGVLLELRTGNVRIIERPSGLPVGARLAGVGVIGLAWIAQGVVTLLGAI
jgi:hypothetical protein